MKKVLISIFLLICIMLSLVSCGSATPSAEKPETLPEPTVIEQTELEENPEVPEEPETEEISLKKFPTGVWYNEDVNFFLFFFRSPDVIDNEWISGEYYQHDIPEGSILIFAGRPVSDVLDLGHLYAIKKRNGTQCTFNGVIYGGEGYDDAEVEMTIDISRVDEGILLCDAYSHEGLIEYEFLDEDFNTGMEQLER